MPKCVGVWVRKKEKTLGISTSFSLSFWLLHYLQHSVSDNYMMIIQSWLFYKKNLCETTNYLSWMPCTCHGIVTLIPALSHAQHTHTHKKSTITRITVNHHQTNQQNKRPIHLIIVHRIVHVHLTSNIRFMFNVKC